MKSLGNGIAKGIVIFTMGLFMVLLEAGPAAAVINITVTGSWTQSIDKNNLTGGPGNGYNRHLYKRTECKPDHHFRCKKQERQLADKHQAYKHRLERPLQIFAIRTSSGTGKGSVSGGQAYIQVTTNDTTFFTGAGNRNGIQIQFQLTGASLTNSLRVNIQQRYSIQ